MSKSMWFTYGGKVVSIMRHTLYKVFLLLFVVGGVVGGVRASDPDPFEVLNANALSVQGAFTTIRRQLQWYEERACTIDQNHIRNVDIIHNSLFSLPNSVIQLSELGMLIRQCIQVRNVQNLWQRSGTDLWTVALGGGEVSVALDRIGWGQATVPIVSPAGVIDQLLGRIIAFSSEQGAVTLVASGMIIPRQDDNGATVYDRVLTCCHIFSVSRPGYEFYFVRNKVLNPDNGCPDGFNISSLQGMRDFMDQNGDAVRRVASFRPCSHHFQSHVGSQTSLIPSDAQDIGWGMLESGFHLPNLVNNAVQIRRAEGIGGHVVLALGYPGLYVFDQNNNVYRYTNPLACSLLRDPQCENGLICFSDGAAAPGMSGGPVLYYDNNKNTISIVGVVQNGTSRNAIRVAPIPQDSL